MDRWPTASTTRCCPRQRRRCVRICTGRRAHLVGRLSCEAFARQCAPLPLDIPTHIITTTTTNTTTIDIARGRKGSRGKATCFASNVYCLMASRTGPESVRPPRVRRGSPAPSPASAAAVLSAVQRSIRGKLGEGIAFTTTCCTIPLRGRTPIHDV